MNKETRKVPAERKHVAKSYGLKSVFVATEKDPADGRPVVVNYLTSFGRGNEAIIEKRYAPDTGIENKNTEAPCFEAEYIKPAADGGADYFGISQDKRPAVNVCRPDDAATDSIGIRSALERKYFGATFEDNIHVQLAYNLLDLEKILAVYANNILYSLGNASGLDEKERDLFDALSTSNGENAYANFMRDDKFKTHRDSFQKFVESPRLGYFGKAFITKVPDPQKENKEIEARRSEEDIYWMLCLLGSLRQAVTHGEGRNDSGWLFNLNKRLPPIIKGESGLLRKLFKERLDDLNGGFLARESKMDFPLLFEVTGAASDGEKMLLAQQYYRFVVYKEQKNLGFSIVTLREALIDAAGDDISCKWDPANINNGAMCSKLRRILDFLLTGLYADLSASDENSGIASKLKPETEELVQKLRAAVGDEEKAAVYDVEARRLLKENQSVYKWLANLPDYAKPEEIARLKKISKDCAVDEHWLDAVLLTSDKVTLFAELFYFITLFLNGKEINDLLTTLINKLENVASLYKVMRALPMGCKLDKEKEYKNIVSCQRYADDLRLIKNLARMEAASPNAKGAMFVDAVRILGLPEGKQTDEFIKESLAAILGESPAGKTASNKNTQLRNFIGKNVINSSRFLYLVRYTRPGNVRALMQNEAVLRFVLNGIPQTQIKRYYNSCINNGDEDEKIMRDKLARLLHGVDFSHFFEIKNLSKEDYSSQLGGSKKQRMQALVGLYLTVAYLIVKNLVNINARYVMGCYRLELDSALLGSTLKEHGHWSDCCAVTRNSLTALAEKIGSWPDEARGIDGSGYRAEYARLAEAWASCGKTKKATKEGGDISKKKDAAWKKLKTATHSYTYRSNNLSAINGSPEAYARYNLLFGEYRNAVAHMNAVNNAAKYIGDIKAVTSWFELYHYLMQRWLIDAGYYCKDENGERLVPFAERFAADEKLMKCANGVHEHNSYSKDLLWLLNLPFAYNLPRYKNLSMDSLFDRNRPQSV